MHLLIALQFLTRIPVSIKSAVTAKDLARSMAYFPLIGLFIGGLAAVVHYLFSFILAGPVCDLFALAFLVIVTGNMHGDGLMDAADGFFSGKPRERILEIMHDSRVGAHGVMACSLVLLAKFALLTQVPAPLKSTALVLFPVLGRWAQVYAASLYHYASSSMGTGSFTKYVGLREIAIASVFSLGAAILFLDPPRGIALACTVLAGTAILAWFACRRIGGVTGDVLGALSECAEVLSLFVLAAMFKNFSI